MELNSALLGPSSKKKKNTPKKINSLYFRKWNFLALILRNFKEWKPPQKILVFREMKLFDSTIKKSSGNGNPENKSPYISGNENHKETFYIFRNGNFQFTLRKNSYASRNRGPKIISYIFSRERFS